VYERRILDGGLPTTGLSAWERTMADDLARTPGVASICFANTAGDTTWLLRGRRGLEIGRVDGAAGGRAVEYSADERGEAAGPAIREYEYRAANRPWYQAAIASAKPLWTPVYSWYADRVTEATIGVGYARTIKERDGTLRGVLVIDITLGGLGAFLRQMPVANVGRVFISDAEGRLVAASEGSISNAKGERLLLTECTDAAVNEAAKVLAKASSKNALLHTARADAAGKPVRLRIEPISPFAGIAWNVITVLPESAFLAEVQHGQQRAVMLAGVAVCGGVLVGLTLGRRLSRPVKKLSSHVDRVGAGEFDQRLELGTAREFSELAEHVNTMAAGLQNRMELQNALTLAREVQQALLPREDPRLAGLDVAGRTHYCDDTGGDYFDFVTPGAAEGRDATARTILVLGDVMGHGIAAALLMATARAALRAFATEGAGLGEVMTRVNRLLAASVRDGNFMTLALLRVDPARGVAAWASAGHDAVIVYEPGADRFSELDGGDIPLGLMEDTEYEEYLREGIDKDAMLCIGTDGIWEMTNVAGEMFGKDRFRDILRKNAARPASEIAAALEGALDAFRGDANQKDDVTFVIVRMVP
jgi:sigma-B regulation protein RsbU (phosphoserine phosphatase)